MKTTELYAFMRKAISENMLQNGDMIKIEDNQIWWSNDGGHTWEVCE